MSPCPEQSRAEQAPDIGNSWNHRRGSTAGQGRRIRGFEGARAPLNVELHPLTAKSTPSKWKENLMKHRFKPISVKVRVVLTFILGLYLCKTAVILHFALN